MGGSKKPPPIWRLLITIYKVYNKIRQVQVYLIVKGYYSYITSEEICEEYNQLVQVLMRAE